MDRVMDSYQIYTLKKLQINNKKRGGSNERRNVQRSYTYKSLRFLLAIRMLCCFHVIKKRTKTIGITVIAKRFPSKI